MKEDPEIIPPEDQGLMEPGRLLNGRFTNGWRGGTGNPTERINVPKLMRRYCRELGLDVEALLADVGLAMLYKGACGDVAAARLAVDMLGETEPSGPLVAVGILNGRMPQPPALAPGADGAPALSEHLQRLIVIAEERGLADLSGRHPKEVLRAIAERAAEAELLS